MYTKAGYEDQYMQGQCMCETVASLYAADEKQRRDYFVEYQNIVLQIQQTVLCMENVNWKIFRDTC